MDNEEGPKGEVWTGREGEKMGKKGKSVWGVWKRLGWRKFFEIVTTKLTIFLKKKDMNTHENNMEAVASDIHLMTQ